MKAVVVDINGKDAAVLRADGRFEKVKNKNYSVGQEISLQTQTLHFPKQAAIAASAALVITVGGGIGTYTWSTPVSYVSLDINPSIAYSLNKFDRVISVSGMNDEGAAIVDEIGSSLKNTDITTALAITVEQLSNDAYLDTDNTNYMVIGVYSDKDNKADALRSTVDAFTASTVDTCSITTVSVSKETKETADSYGITAGKMELINEIADVAADPQEVDPAALADLTVAQLEQTKAAAATGTSLSSAVASATPDAEENTETPEQADTESASTSLPADDPNAIVSDSKPENSAEHTSSVKKEEQLPTPDTSNDQLATASEDTPQTPAANGDEQAANNASDTPAADSATPPVSPADSTGTGSSIKKNDSHETKTDESKTDKKEDHPQTPTESVPPSTSSPSKGETTSSEKKEESSSSDKSTEKNEPASSPEKTDTITEDDSQQTNSAPIS